MICSEELNIKWEQVLQRVNQKQEREKEVSVR